MKFLKLKRALKEGWTNFKRNTWLTFATVAVLTLSLFVIGNTLFIGMSAYELIKNIEKNVNISVYLKSSTSEDRINEIKNILEQKAEVASVEYVSKEDALEKFSSEHNGDEVIEKALEEIGENPLFSSLVITAADQSQYESLNSYIESNFEDEVDRINYSKNKTRIEDLSRAMQATRKIGLMWGAVFVLISILVTFSAIRMSLYTRKKEFDIMRLVGASNLYIKVPFVIEGAMYGLAASLLATIFVAGFVYGEIPFAQDSISREEVLRFYLDGIWKVGLALFLTGIFIGIFSSLISIRKYLKI